MGIRGEIFSSRIVLPNRTYFFNVKENRMGDIYLNIVESKNRDNGGFDRQSVILFADDLQEFLKGFDESLKVLEKSVREKRHGAKREGKSAREDSGRNFGKDRGHGDAPKKYGNDREKGDAPRKYGRDRSQEDAPKKYGRDRSQGDAPKMYGKERGGRNSQKNFGKNRNSTNIDHGDRKRLNGNKRVVVKKRGDYRE